MSRTLPALKSLRATPDQTTATPEQLELLQDFLREGRISYAETGVHEKFLLEIIMRKEEDVAFEQMLVFLWLSQICPKGYRIAPADAIDAVWHQFILFTREYQRFCLSTVGRMIHHEPLTSKNRQDHAQKSIWPPGVSTLKVFVGRTAQIKADYWREACVTGVSCIRD